MNILEQAKQKKSGVVTKNGKRVTILKTDARGEYPLIGYISEGTHDRVIAWGLDGHSAGPFAQDDLEVWTMTGYFPWSDLPSWANTCVYRSGDRWFCSSMVPDWNGDKGTYVHASREHCTLELPEVITRDILWDPSNGDSLSLNPERDEEA